jgi:hypothetical protein
MDFHEMLIISTPLLASKPSYHFISHRQLGGHANFRYENDNTWSQISRDRNLTQLP